MTRPAISTHVSLRQLRAFVAVAGEGGMTRAASRLHLTPSALSMLIRGLEAELGVRLFDRTGRRVELTAAGRELLPALEEALGCLEEALLRARASGEAGATRLTVATSPLLAAEFLPRVIAHFQAEYPGIRVALADMGVDAVAAAVRDARAELGICTADADMPGLAAVPLYQDRLLLACPESHTLAARRSVRWREIVGEPLVMLRRGTGQRALVEATLKALGERVEPAHEVSNVGTAIGMVEAGLGLAVLPAFALESPPARGVTGVPLTEPVVHRDIVALSAQGRTLSVAGETFLAHVRRALGNPVAVTPKPRPRRAR